jgi:hypothetical protein
MVVGINMKARIIQKCGYVGIPESVLAESVGDLDHRVGGPCRRPPVVSDSQPIV